MPKDVHQHLAIYAKKGWKTLLEKYEEAHAEAFAARQLQSNLSLMCNEQYHFTLKPILLQCSNGMGFYDLQEAQMCGGVSSINITDESHEDLLEDKTEKIALVHSMRLSRPEFRDWKASDKSKTQEDRWLNHISGAESAERGELCCTSIKKNQVHVLNASRPLVISSCGNVIRVGSSDPAEVFDTFDDQTTKNVQQNSVLRHYGFPISHDRCEAELRFPTHSLVIKNLHFRFFDSDSQLKFYLRRLLRVLLQPLFPNCADDVAFGVGVDACFRHKCSLHYGLNLSSALRFWVMSQTSIRIQELEQLLVKDFDYQKFQKYIKKHVVSVAVRSAAAENDWLLANFVQPVKHPVKGFFAHSIRELDYESLEHELHRLTAIRSIMSQCQPRFASMLANSFFLRFEPKYLDRLIHSPQTSSAKFEMALSELEKRCPNEAEILKFYMARRSQFHANKTAAYDGIWSTSITFREANRQDLTLSHGSHLGAQTIPLTQRQLPTKAPLCKQDSKEILSEAVQNPFCRGAAVAGTLGPLPAWLQDLQCTTVVNEDHPIQLTCGVPTKVYLLSVGPRSIEAVAALPNMWELEGRQNWAFVKEKYIWPQIRRQIYMNPLATSTETIGISYSPDLHNQCAEGMFLEASKFHEASAHVKERVISSWHNYLHRLPTSTFDVFSTLLMPGTYALDTTDAIYFFDTEHHAQQQRLLQSSDAPVCPCYQRTQACALGDRCTFSHRSPLIYTPDIFVYIGFMQQQCCEQLCAQLRLPITNSATMRQTRARVYMQHTTPSWFPARSRVLSSALVKELVLRLLLPIQQIRVRYFKKINNLAAHALTMRLYNGLMVKAAEIDNDTFSFVEHGGYVYRTLLGRHHTTGTRHLLDCGAVSFQGLRTYENLKTSSTRQLPTGYEICPADAVSIEVCSLYEWASLALLLGDGHCYGTRVYHDIVQKRFRTAKKQDTDSAGKDCSARIAGAACSVSCHGSAVVPPSFYKPPMPKVQPLTARVETGAKIVGVNDRVVELIGGDMLIRRRRWGFM